VAAERLWTAAEQVAATRGIVADPGEHERTVNELALKWNAEPKVTCEFYLMVPDTTMQAVAKVVLEDVLKAKQVTPAPQRPEKPITVPPAPLKPVTATPQSSYKVTPEWRLQGYCRRRSVDPPLLRRTVWADVPE
jgi:hypothetical protein